MSPEIRTVAQVKKKWFDIKVDAKKRIINQKKRSKQPEDKDHLICQPEMRLTVIIGQTSISGILPRNEGESDDMQHRLSPRGYLFHK